MKTKETRAEELARTITELGLEHYILEIAEQGSTVVPPSITGVTEEQVDQLTQLLLDESEKYVGCKFTVEGGSECELDYGDFPGAIEQISGVKPAQFMMVQLCKIHRAFRDLAVNPAAIAIVNHLIGSDGVPGSPGESWAARFSSFNAFIKWQGDGYGESLGLHADQTAVPLPWGDTALNANCTWALTDYTEAGGAIAVVPGSHKLKSRPGPDAVENAIPVECPRGSLIALPGTTWHGAYPKSTPGLRVNIGNYFRHSSILPQEDIPNHFPRDLIDDCIDPKTFKWLVGSGSPYRTPPLPFPRAVRKGAQAR